MLFARLLLAVCFLVGCANLDHWGYRPENYHYSFAKTERTGTLFIRFLPYTHRFGVEGYGLRVDDYQSKYFARESYVDLTLDEGLHTLELFALHSSDVIGEGKVFGKPTFRKVELKAGERLTFDYTGPTLHTLEGKLEEA